MTMNPPHTPHAHHIVLAGLGSTTSVVAFVIGLVVVLILIAGFWLGFRRRPTTHPSPEEQPHGPGYQSHLEGTADANDVFPDDGGRLLPHELGGHGDEVRPPSDDAARPGASPDTGDKRGRPTGGPFQ
jgi:hypothetical protein